MKKIFLLFSSLFALSLSNANTLCEKEMKKFIKFSEINRKQYCNDCGYDDDKFNNFSKCLYDRVKQFNKNITKTEFYSVQFNELEGIKGICDAFCYSVEKSKKASPSKTYN